MHNPPHPGEFLAAVYLEPFSVSGRELAVQLDVSPSTLSRVLKGTSRVTPEMALRLSKAVGRSAEKLAGDARRPRPMGRTSEPRSRACEAVDARLCLMLPEHRGRSEHERREPR
ncbi:MAG: HigA family addiction module antitoxin [Microcella pacifica]